MLRGSRLLDPAAARDLLFALAREEGFDAMGIARADSIPQAGERLREWIESGRHGEMAWMPETAERRSSPENLWPDMRCVLMLGQRFSGEDRRSAVSGIHAISP